MHFNLSNFSKEKMDFQLSIVTSKSSCFFLETQMNMNKRNKENAPLWFKNICYFSRNWVFKLKILVHLESFHLQDLLITKFYKIYLRNFNI